MPRGRLSTEGGRHCFGGIESCRSSRQRPTFPELVNPIHLVSSIMPLVRWWWFVLMLSSDIKSSPLCSQMRSGVVMNEVRALTRNRYFDTARLMNMRYVESLRMFVILPGERSSWESHDNDDLYRPHLRSSFFSLTTTKLGHHDLLAGASPSTPCE